MHPYLVDTQFASRQPVALIDHEEIDKNQLQKHAAEMGQEAAFFCEDFLSADVQEDIVEIHVRHRFETYAKAAPANGEALAEIDRLNRAIDHKQKSLESLSAAPCSSFHGLSRNTSPDSCRVS